MTIATDHLIVEVRNHAGWIDVRRLIFAVAGSRWVSAEIASDTARQAHQPHGALGITQGSGRYRRTPMLWADRDEGVGSVRTEPAGPVAESESWELTRPEVLQ
nr:hypothetical protein [uncultured Rhodococcus sp.]